MRGDEVQPDFAQFLLARIAEDRESATQAEWAMQGGWFTTADDQVDAFVQRQSPARVLAECAAKRSIIEAHPYGGDQSMPAHCCADPGDYLGEQMYHDEPCPTLAAMLSVYADHKDFRKEWLG